MVLCCFFKIRRMDSRLMVSKPFFVLSSSWRSCSVHFFLPAGGEVQARAAISVSCFITYFFGCPGRGLSFSADSNPSSIYAFFILQTVCRWVWSSAAILVSFSPLLAAKRTLARNISRAFLLPLLWIRSKTWPHLIYLSCISKLFMQYYKSIQHINR